MGIGMGEETGKLILSIFSILAVVAIGYVLFRLTAHKSPLPYFVALIFGGAIGNIIDRTFYGLFFSSTNTYGGGLFHGRVVDMFYFDIGDVPLPEFMGGGSYHLWPIFNIADSAITIGIIILLIFQSKFFKMDEAARKTLPEPENINPDV
jgi:signal peptidase II